MLHSPSCIQRFSGYKHLRNLVFHLQTSSSHSDSFSPWELSFGLEKIFECFFFYDFDMILLWFRYAEKYGFVMVSKCYVRGIWFSMIFLWCGTASAKQNCECQSTKMWNKQSPICYYEKKTYTRFKLETSKIKKEKCFQIWYLELL